MSNHDIQHPSTIVILVNPDDVSGENSAQSQLSIRQRALDMLGLENDEGINFKFIKRTKGIFSIKNGFPEYIAALDLCPNLIIANQQCHYDAVLIELGIPYMVMGEYDSATIDTLKTTLKNHTWKKGSFQNAPPTIQDASTITILGEGRPRGKMDEGVVIAMSVLDMFTNPAPDFFFHPEHPISLHSNSEGSVIGNRSCDKIILNAPTLPLQIASNDTSLWEKALEYRPLSRLTSTIVSPWLIVSPYYKVYHEEYGNIFSAVFVLIQAIRQINPTAKIVYKAAPKFMDSPIDTMETIALKNGWSGVEYVDDDDEYCEALNLHIHLDTLDMNLVYCGEEISQRIYHHRQYFMENTFVDGSDCWKMFVESHGFGDDPDQEMNAEITLAPTFLYPL